MQSISAWTFGFHFFRKKKEWLRTYLLVDVAEPERDAEALRLGAGDGFSLSLSRFFLSRRLNKANLRRCERASRLFLPRKKQNQSINRLPRACTHARMRLDTL
jgi:hypothetical protein